jgi:hypothetical protein
MTALDLSARPAVEKKKTKERLAMAAPPKPDLVFHVACGEDSSRMWVLDPQGRDSFRIIVRSQEAKTAAFRKSRSWFGHFLAAARAILAMFAFRHSSRH